MSNNDMGRQENMSSVKACGNVSQVCKSTVEIAESVSGVNMLTDGDILTRYTDSIQSGDHRLKETVKSPISVFNTNNSISYSREPGGHV